MLPQIIYQLLASNLETSSQTKLVPSNWVQERWVFIDSQAVLKLSVLPGHLKQACEKKWMHLDKTGSGNEPMNNFRQTPFTYYYSTYIHIF